MKTVIGVLNKTVKDMLKPGRSIIQSDDGLLVLIGIDGCTPVATGTGLEELYTNFIAVRARDVANGQKTP